MCSYSDRSGLSFLGRIVDSGKVRPNRKNTKNTVGVGVGNLSTEVFVQEKCICEPW